MATITCAQWYFWFFLSRWILRLVRLQTVPTRTLTRLTDSPKTLVFAEIRRKGADPSKALNETGVGMLAMANDHPPFRMFTEYIWRHINFLTIRYLMADRIKTVHVHVSGLVSDQKVYKLSHTYTDRPIAGAVRSASICRTRNRYSKKYERVEASEI